MGQEHGNAHQGGVGQVDASEESHDKDNFIEENSDSDTKRGEKEKHSVSDEDDMDEYETSQDTFDEKDIYLPSSQESSSANTFGESQSQHSCVSVCFILQPQIWKI